MPSTLLQDSIQAKAAGGLKVIDLEYKNVPTVESNSKQVKDLAAELRQTEDQISSIENAMAVLETKIVFLNSMASRSSEDASRDAGTAALDTAVIEDQLSFLGNQMAILLTQQLDEKTKLKESQDEAEVLKRKIKNIGSQRDQNRRVMVTFVATQATKATIELTYLVNNASWTPTYSVRANFDDSMIGFEYDAIVSQKTGEDWTDVNMVLSTAQPSRASEPPTINPYFVDIYAVPPPAASRPDRRAAPSADSASLEMYVAEPAAAGRGRLESLAAGANVAGSGSAVTFKLPRKLTIASGDNQQQRTRIATFDNQVAYINIAIPVLTEDVYIKGEIKNTSDYQFLPGLASIFVGNDYVGQSFIDAVAPASSYELYFGIDPAISSKRTLLEKRTDNTGLFGGGRETTYKVRIEIDNGTDRAIDLELWDRWPVSRSGDITISMSEINPALSKNKTYVETQENLGLLRWDLVLPANTTGTNAKLVTYTYAINRGKDIQTTPLP